MDLHMGTEYWRDLGTSTIFEGRSLVTCLARIHDDIIEVWNFRDPHKVRTHLDLVNIAHSSRMSFFDSCFLGTSFALR